MARRTPKLDAGDLLAIPLPNERYAIGQIVLPGITFYIGIDPTPRKTLDVPIGFGPRLFAWTNDAELYRGSWRKLADRLPVASNFPRPDFKVGIDGQIMVESFEGQLLRDFDSIRDCALTYRSSFSPLLVQDAVQAFNGVGAWLPSYDKMLPRQPQS